MSLIQIITLSLATSAIAQLDLSTAFTYQGRLTDGANLVNGFYDFEFSLWDAINGGNEVGTTFAVTNVSVSNGLFRAEVNFGSTAFSASPRWLGIAVRMSPSSETFTTLTPRQAILGTPYALHALSVSQVPATNLTGIVPDALLSSNVVLANAPNHLMGNQSITEGSLGIGTENPGAALDVLGTVIATGFAGDGAGLTNILPANIAGAEPPADLIPVTGMVWIKPGTFIMGSRNDELGRGTNESPQTVVTITKGFWMGVHEVTQAEYLRAIGRNPSVFKVGDSMNRPVESVRWDDATNYCGMLTLFERAAGRLSSGWLYRLPTEAEWEYCCRAGARTTRFGYGDDTGATALSNYAWFIDNSSNMTHSVEQKWANAWGIMDMHGNVAEWCQDWLGTYQGGRVQDPQGPDTGDPYERVVRGGIWSTVAFNCRSAIRRGVAPAGYGSEIGFRIVLASN